MRWYGHLHGPDVGGAAKELEARPQGARDTVAEGIAVSVQMLDVRVGRDGAVGRVLEQLVVRKLQHSAAGAMAREHEGRRERVALQANALRVAEVRGEGDRTQAASQQL